jgi:hypothetical protein
MELGLDSIWDDGICCTGLLVHAEPDRVGRLLGRHTALVKDQRVVKVHPANPVAYAMRPLGSNWTIVEFHQRMVDEAMNSNQDYLVPLFEQAIGAILGNPPTMETFIYETPVSAAAYISRELRTPSIALWGSDEHPGLSGGAFFSDDGNLELVCSAFSLDEVKRWFVDRTTPKADFDDADEDDLQENEEITHVYLAGAQPAVEHVFISDYLDKEFRDRGAAFDGADLLQDLYRATLTRNIGDEFGDVDSFYVVERDRSRLGLI